MVPTFRCSLLLMTIHPLASIGGSHRNRHAGSNREIFSYNTKRQNPKYPQVSQMESNHRPLHVIQLPCHWTMGPVQKQKARCLMTPGLVEFGPNVMCAGKTMSPRLTMPNRPDWRRKNLRRVAK